MEIHFLFSYICTYKIISSFCLLAHSIQSPSLPEILPEIFSIQVFTENVCQPLPWRIPYRGDYMRINSITNNHLYSCYLWCGSCIQNLCLFLYGIHMHDLSLFIGDYPDLQFHLTFGCLGECMTICLRHSSITSHSWFLLCLTDLDIKSYHPHRGLRVCQPPSPFYNGLETKRQKHNCVYNLWCLWWW